MRQKKELSHSYENFCSKEGNQHIASEYAIEKLDELVKRFNVGDVLEVGLGIGSIAASLLKVNGEINYSGTETNEFCLRSLELNLEEDFDRLNIFDSLKLLPLNHKFDLVIIDGKDPDLSAVQKLLSPNGIIAVEGDRLPQQELLLKLFPHHKYVHLISIKKSKVWSVLIYELAGWAQGHFHKAKPKAICVVVEREDIDENKIPLSKLFLIISSKEEI